MGRFRGGGGGDRRCRRQPIKSQVAIGNLRNSGMDHTVCTALFEIG